MASSDQITYGSHFMRPMGAAYDYLTVFGRVPTVPEIVASEILGVTEYAGTEAHGKAVARAELWLSHAGVLTGPDSLAAALNGDGDLNLVLDRMDSVPDRPGSCTHGMTLVYLRDLNLNGQRFAKCYSLACVDGEYGSTPIAAMIPLTAAEFATAQLARWDFGLLSDPHRRGHQDWAVLIATGGPEVFTRKVPT